MQIAIIGGGAAGIFSAITCAETNPHAKIIVFEKNNNLLSKVKISGGGRCNVTHACFDNDVLREYYPRGKKELRNPFLQFSTKETIEWFQKHGVKLKTESDGRIFPKTDDSQTIIDCLLQKIYQLRIHIKMRSGISSIIKRETGFELTLQNKEKFLCDKVIVATGGNPEIKNYEWLTQIGINIISPVPSLFTFNIPNSPFKGLEGISVNPCSVKILSTSLQQTGALLLTHWGVSGPAVLTLSAFGARVLKEMNYQFSISLNFFPAKTEKEVEEYFHQLKKEHPTKTIINTKIDVLSQRLWERICTISEIGDDVRWVNLSKQQMQKILRTIFHCELFVQGKTTFKEEFVTAGGVDLKEVEMKTLESKKISGLFFAGEILNIDGVTGGFNFQNAWTTGWIAGKNAALY